MAGPPPYAPPLYSSSVPPAPLAPPARPPAGWQLIHAHPDHQYYGWYPLSCQSINGQMVLAPVPMPAESIHGYPVLPRAVPFPYPPSYPLLLSQGSNLVHNAPNPFGPLAGDSTNPEPPFSHLQDPLREILPLDKEIIEKIRYLNLQSPPLKIVPLDQRHKVGLIIAIEGDSFTAVQYAAEKLIAHVQKERYVIERWNSPNTKVGPSTWAVGAFAEEEYMKVVASEVKHMNRHMTSHITAWAPAGANWTSPKPRIGLVDCFQYNAIESFCPAIPTRGYPVKNHWRHLAKMWHGCVGADFTIYIKDCDQVELIRGELVEWLPAIRCFVVRRDERFKDGEDHEFTVKKMCEDVMEMVCSGSSGLDDVYKWPAYPPSARAPAPTAAAPIPTNADAGQQLKRKR